MRGSRQAAKVRPAPLFISAAAEQDIEAIGDFIAQDNPLRALSFVQELREQCERIARQPSIYKLRPELGGGVRSCAFGRYVVYFVATDAQVLIARVLHGARDQTVALGADDSV